MTIALQMKCCCNGGAGEGCILCRLSIVLPVFSFVREPQVDGEHLGTGDLVEADDDKADMKNCDNEG